MEYITITGARENNLKNVSLRIPKREITIFTGVSGSGKSSIVFDTIAQEAGRQLNENFSKFVRGFMPKYSRPDMDSISNLSMTVAVDQSRIGGNSRSTLGTITDIQPLIRLLFSRIGTPYIGPAWNFSFNDPHGMCKNCEGIGRLVTLDVSKAIDFDKSLKEGAVLLPGYPVGSWQWKFYAATGFFDCDKKIKDYSPGELNKFLYGKAEKMNSIFMEGMNSTYEGVVERFNRQYVKTDSELSASAAKRISPFMTEEVCQKCGGSRYNDEVLACKIMGKNIAEVTAM